MRPRTAAAISAVTIALAAAGAWAQHEGHGTGAAARPELGASAAVDPGGRIWVAYKDGPHVKVRASSDAGVTWDAPRIVNAQPEAVVATGDSFPKIAAGPGGEIYVAWSRSLGRGHIGDVRFSRSVDGGKGFADPVTVHAHRSLIQHSHESMAVAGSGTVYVAWIDGRDGPTGLWYSVSEDRGGSFAAERAGAVRSCECCRIGLAGEPDGSATAFWRNVFGDGARDHALVRLTPSGPRGERRATFDDWRVDACPHHGPSIARDGEGRLHAVWYSGVPGREGVYYGRLEEGAVEGRRRVGGDTAAHADLAAAGQRLAIAWKEFDGARSRLKALRSDDAGTSWRELDLAEAASATDNPRVIVREGSFLVLWNSTERPLRVVALP